MDVALGSVRTDIDSHGYVGSHGNIHVRSDVRNVLTHVLNGIDCDIREISGRIRPLCVHGIGRHCRIVDVRSIRRIGDIPRYRNGTA
jgi:hypothetical protein